MLCVPQNTPRLVAGGATPRQAGQFAGTGHPPLAQSNLRAPNSTPGGRASDAQVHAAQPQLTGSPQQPRRRSPYMPRQAGASEASPLARMPARNEAHPPTGTSSVAQRPMAPAAIAQRPEWASLATGGVGPLTAARQRARSLMDPAQTAIAPIIPLPPTTVPALQTPAAIAASANRKGLGVKGLTPSHSGAVGSSAAAVAAQAAAAAAPAPGPSVTPSTAPKTAPPTDSKAGMFGLGTFGALRGLTAKLPTTLFGVTVPWQAQESATQSPATPAAAQPSPQQQAAHTPAPSQLQATGMAGGPKEASTPWAEPHTPLPPQATTQISQAALSRSRRPSLNEGSGSALPPSNRSSQALETRSVPLRASMAAVAAGILGELGEEDADGVLMGSICWAAMPQAEHPMEHAGAGCHAHVAAASPTCDENGGGAVEGAEVAEGGQSSEEMQSVRTRPQMALHLQMRRASVRLAVRGVAGGPLREGLLAEHAGVGQVMYAKVSSNDGRVV